MALDLPERRIVALRSLPIESKYSPETATKLLEAGHWVKGLDDPAVMTPLEVGTQEGLMHAAYLYGISEPLRGILRMTSFKGQSIPMGVALRIAHDVALGARAVEACGVPPRVGDSLCGALLPDSVMVGQDGRTRLCDVGIGAVLRREAIAEHSDLLAYAAPEQAHRAGPSDGRTDVYTIGIFLWEMLANRRLFSSVEAGKSRTFDVPPIESLPRGSGEPVTPAVAALVTRALEQVPANRFAGTTALLQAIEQGCPDVLAPPAAVQAFMRELFDAIFENRARSMQSALDAAPPTARESLTAPPAPVRDARPRAAAPKKQVAADSDKERVAPVSSSNGNTTDQDSRETLGIEGSAPDTVRELTPAHAATGNEMTPNANGTAVAAEDAPMHAASSSRLPPPPPPVRLSRPAPVFGSKPPLSPALPALPRQFELPGADLFATPGLPLVKPSAPDRAGTEVNPVGPTIPAPPIDDSAAAEPKVPEASDGAEASSIRIEPAEPERAFIARAPRRKFRFTWVALLSIIAFGFFGGVAVRRCTKVETRASPTRVDVVSASPVLATPDAATIAAAALAASTTSDAGAPMVSASASASASVEAPATTTVRRSAAKGSSKVSKGRGKTTRSH